MTEPVDDRDAQIEAAAEEYFRAREQGEAIDREAFLRKYPDIADELAAFLEGGDLLGSRLGATQGWDPVGTTSSQQPSIGDLEFGEEIGRGGMGVVYRAVQRSLGRTVAVKRIRFSNAFSPELVERFRFEARAAAKLSHPNILPILTFLETDDEVLIVMPFIAGGDLRRRLEEGPLPPRTAAQIVAEVADGVAHAHARGILHRDVKPANIMFDDDGHALIADFGVAKSLESDSGLTRTGQVVGTPSYMAPEQASGDETVGPAADVYALGATLYTLLVGRPPFQADSPFATIQLVRDHEPVRPRLLNPNVPTDLQAIAIKCLQKSPADRYASATELAADLRRFLDDEPVRAEPAGNWRRIKLAFGQRRNRERFEPWGAAFVQLGLLALSAHVLMELAALVWADWLLPRLAIRGAVLMVLVLWLGKWRDGDVWPRNPFERSLWATWIGNRFAVVIADVCLAALSRPREEAVAVESLLEGLAFISSGALSWGGCYVAGAAFLMLSIPAWFGAPGVDLAFGVLWLATLLGLATRGIRQRDQ